MNFSCWSKESSLSETSVFILLTLFYFLVNGLLLLSSASVILLIDVFLPLEVCKMPPETIE